MGGRGKKLRGKEGGEERQARATGSAWCAALEGPRRGGKRKGGRGDLGPHSVVLLPSFYESREGRGRKKEKDRKRRGKRKERERARQLPDRGRKLERKPPSPIATIKIGRRKKGGKGKKETKTGEGGREREKERCCGHLDQSFLPFRLSDRGRRRRKEKRIRSSPLIFYYNSLGSTLQKGEAERGRKKASKKEREGTRRQIFNQKQSPSPVAALELKRKAAEEKKNRGRKKKKVLARSDVRSGEDSGEGGRGRKGKKKGKGRGGLSFT